MTIKLADGRNELWQWDTNRKVAVDDETVKQVHFQNHCGSYGRTIDVDVVDGTAKIPDELLQTARPLTVYAYVGEEPDGYTQIEKVFEVKARKRPAGYVFTTTEQLTLKEVQDQLQKAIEEVHDHRNLTNRDAEDQHPIDAITGLEAQLKTIPPAAERITNSEIEEMLK